MTMTVKSRNENGVVSSCGFVETKATRGLGEGDPRKILFVVINICNVVLMPVFFSGRFNYNPLLFFGCSDDAMIRRSRDVLFESNN